MISGHPSRVPLAALGAILLLAAAARLVWLDTLPPGFFCDEAAIGVAADRLLRTGRDEHGEPFPVFFRSLGDYRHPLAVYATVPLVALFGLTEAAIRLQSVLHGLATVLLLYLLGARLHSWGAGLWAALVGATLPWLVHYNRAGFEFSAYAAWFTLTVYLFVRAATDRRWIVPACFVAGLTIYTYQPAKLLAPLLLVGLVAVFQRELKRFPEELATGLLGFTLVAIPLGHSFVVGTATARFELTSIGSLNLPLGETIVRAAQHVALQVSPSLLFWEGEPTFIVRHFTGGRAPVLLVLAPFILLALYRVVVGWRQRPSQVLLLWLLLYPVAGALVAEAPFTSRSIIGAPLVALLAGIGLDHATAPVAHRVTRLLVGLRTPIAINFVRATLAMFVLGNFGGFWWDYTTRYPIESVGYSGWQYGSKEVIARFVVREAEYDDFVLAPQLNAPGIFYDFYAEGACGGCTWGWPEERYVPGRRQLFAVPPEFLNPPTGLVYVPVDTVHYPHGEVAFALVELRDPE